MTDSDVQTVVEWTAIPGYYGELTKDGQVRSIDRKLVNGRQVRGRELARRISNRGYVLVDLYDYEGFRCTRTVHSLQLLTFVGPCPPGRETRHLNDIPYDNRWPENLCYGTPGENAADKVRNAPTPLATRRSLSRFVADYVGSLLRRRSR
jgi:hypothetical protein